MVAKLLVLIGIAVLAVGVATYGLAKYAVPAWVEYRTEALKVQHRQEREERERTERLVQEAEKEYEKRNDG